MAMFDSADLLARTKRLLNRPTTDEALGDSDLYAALTETQYDVVLFLASRVPDALMVAPTALTAAGDNKTFTFGTDADSANIIALGHYILYPSLASIPESPLFEGSDYVVEPDKIRIPGNSTRSSTIYGQWVNPPGLIDASTAPTLVKPARIALPFGAAAKAAVRLRMDPSDFDNRFTSTLRNVCTALRTRSAGAGNGRGGSGPRTRRITWDVVG